MIAAPPYDAETIAALEAQTASLLDVFKTYGAERIEPAIVQPADAFLDRMGEELRRRTYVFTGPDGTDVLVEMGSYGVGVSRLVGAIIEASHDDAGIVWPEPVTPFMAGIVNLKVGDGACDKACDDIYRKLEAKGVETLLDDRDARAGAKFADMDLIGLPWQVVVGPRGLEKGVVELKNRKSGERQEISIESALSRLVG